MRYRKKHKKFQEGGSYDLRGALTGVAQGAGGTDMMGNALPGMIPGGGIISGAGDVFGGIAGIIGAGKDIKRGKKQKKKANQAIKDFYKAEGEGKVRLLDISG